MIFLRILVSIVLFSALATCGGDGPSTSPPAADGALFGPNFTDKHPVKFNGRSPQSYPVHGTDVARFQNHMDWNTARRSGTNFVFVKATEGGDLLDPKFRDHWNAAGQAGVARGAYHFYYFCTSPEDQARWFIRNVPKAAGNLPPVLDMEWNPYSPTCAHRRPEGSVVRDEMRRWLAIVEKHYGQKAIIYTTPRFYRENGLAAFKGYDFWLRTTAKSPSEAFPGQRWTFWQYSSTGVIPGSDVGMDLNAFNGNRAQWNAWRAARQAR